MILVFLLNLSIFLLTCQIDSLEALKAHFRLVHSFWSKHGQIKYVLAIEVFMAWEALINNRSFGLGYSIEVIG